MPVSRLITKPSFPPARENLGASEWYLRPCLNAGGLSRG
jgi:hypothetical protein